MKEETTDRIAEAIAKAIILIPLLFLFMFMHSSVGFEKTVIFLLVLMYVQIPITKR